MKVIYNSKSQCSGCAACLNICPKNAIDMKPDEEGFLYPEIDETLCINCGACERVCHLKNNKFDKLKSSNLQALALKHKEDTVISNSSSGGAFTAISDYVLNNGGQVFGAVFDDKMKVMNIKATTFDNRDRMRGSKYIQSDIKDVFKTIKKDLDETESLILFSGTPCQVASLKSYLGDKVDLSSLLLCDIVCHGVTSPRMWQEHINLIQNKRGKKVINYKFRDKSNKIGGAYTSTIFYEDGKCETGTALCQSYIDIYNNKTVRPSCYECKYTDVNRVSDITIADFWGIEKAMPDFDNRNGASLILINTEKGEKLFNNIKESVEYRCCKLQDCMQPQLKHPIDMAKDRQNFWNEYKQKGYKHVLKKYTWYGGKKRIKFELKKFVPTNVKVIVKKFLKKV